MRDIVLQAFALGIVLGAAFMDGIGRHDKVESIGAGAVMLLVVVLRGRSWHE